MIAIGQIISHYRVLEPLGEGGMGVVYRAEDLRLGREVAIKLLEPASQGEAAALVRFQREARLASALNHPNICTIHELGEHDGRPFIVMELVEGKPLRELVRGGPLPPDRLLDLAIQIGEALEAAHRRGIVHRDLKPANVFVTASDHVKVLDFGLAKLVRSRLGPDDSGSFGSPSPGLDESDTRGSAGTISYMSPEQARGEVLDQRTDLFSFGAVLFQMATGHHAFPGPTPAVVFDAILNRAPARPRELNPSCPIEVEQIIDKALEKDRELRYQHAADVLVDLRRARRATGRSASSTQTAAQPAFTTTVAATAARRTGRARRWWLGVAAGSVALAGLAALGTALWPRSPAPLTERDSVLIADFVNSTGDPVFDDTLKAALAVQLSQSPFLDIVPEERVRETLQMMTRPPETALTPALAREVCERQGVKAMLGGSIARLGQMYVLTLEAVDCRQGDAIATEQQQVETKERVLQGLGRIASAIRARLGESLATLSQYDVPIEQATTPSIDALKAYALGVARRASGADLESIPFFRRAIELDPQFASAYSALSSVYGNLGENDRREHYARLAYDRRGHVSARERLFIEYQFHDAVTGDEPRAVEILEVWKQSYPRDYRPANALAVVMNRFGLYDRARDEALEAQRRNPSHPFPYSNLAYAHRGANRFTEARRAAEQAVTRGIETVPTRRLLYQLALLDGDLAAADGHLAWARNQPREFDLVGAQAQAAAFRGQMRRARELYQLTVEMAERREFPQIALGYAAQAAWTEVLYGEVEEASARARLVAGRNPGSAPALRAAAVLALAGAPASAEPLVEVVGRARPDDTFVQSFYLPLARAAIRLARGQADPAIEVLRDAAPYERGSVAALAPIYLRGLAWLQSRSPDEAAAQFRTVLDHRGVDPFSPLLPLARVGLARALALGGDREASRAEYEAILRDWSDADADVPVLVAARAELQALGSQEPRRAR
jgi:tetratricopeptide (TPR) repeat protein/predicted Ser/Thr protein kinase